MALETCLGSNNSNSLPEEVIANSPLPNRLRGKHGSKLSQDFDLNGSAGGVKGDKTLSVPVPNGAPKSGPDAVSVLEAKANGM